MHIYTHIQYIVNCVHIICWGAFPLPVRHQEAFTFTTVGDPCKALFATVTGRRASQDV